MVDVDGVVIVPQPGGWAATMELDLGLSVAVLQEHLFARDWEEVILGRAGLHERLAPILARHAPHLTCEQLTAYWFEKDANLDGQLLADLAAVRATGIELHLATVQEHLRADYLWTTLGLRHRFDALHYAADLAARKPDPEFFARIGARTGLAPAEMLLIDDRPENVEAARAAGWRAAHWTGEARLFDLLPDLAGAG